MMIDPNNSHNTLVSNSLRFLNNRMMEPVRIREITYSLILLNWVSPVPSIKQIGKMFEKIENTKKLEIAI